MQVLLAGALYALCFAPGPLPAWCLPFVQIATMAVLAAHVWQAQGPRQAALLGWLFGLAQFTTGVYWLTISMHVHGGLAMPLAIGALLLFAAAMALYGALACALVSFLCLNYRSPRQAAGRQILNALTWASAWTLAEWLRGTLFTGFTWLNAGYAHVEGMFAPWAPIIGVYGLGWLAAFAAAATALMARARDTPNDRSAASTVGLAIGSGLVGIFLGHVQWSQPVGELMVVRLVQANTAQSMKFDPASFAATQERLQFMAGMEAKSPESKPRLIILPETSIPVFQDQVPDLLWQQWHRVAREMNADIMLGLPLHLHDADGDRYTNSAALIRAAATDYGFTSDDWHYDKRHLVPFGEFIPAGFRWFVNAMNIPLGDFNRGQLHQPPLQTGQQSMAVNICYEDTFGEEIAAGIAGTEAGLPGASILVNISNLAWFGDSWALRQHLRMARMRSLETARPMLRATNTGMTAMIDPYGQVLGLLEPNKPGILDTEIQGTSGLTPYVRWGNSTILLAVLACLMLSALLRGHRQRPIDQA